MLLVNGMKFNDKEFHNGETIFEKPELVVKKVVEGREDECYNEIEMFFKSDKDITALMFAKSYLDDVAPRIPCVLTMKYCPYERMDREINQQLFSMKYFAHIIAKFGFSKVRILDPHSRVCVEELESAGVKVEVLDLKDYVTNVIEDFKPDYICYPDKGAKTKYTEVLADIDIPCFYGSKKRDLANQGRIMEYELVDAPDLKGKRVLIIDDICCLGGTAYNAASLMKKAGAEEVAFYISHCEDGIFAGKILHEECTKNRELEDGKFEIVKEYMIDSVYTANTMKLKQDNSHIYIVIGG